MGEFGGGGGGRRGSSGGKSNNVHASAVKRVFIIPSPLNRLSCLIYYEDRQINVMKAENKLHTALVKGSRQDRGGRSKG